MEGIIKYKKNLKTRTVPNFPFHICYFRFPHFLPHSGILELFFIIISMLPSFLELNSTHYWNQEFGCVWSNGINLSSSPESTCIFYTSWKSDITGLTFEEKKVNSVKMSSWNCALLHKEMAVPCQTKFSSIPEPCIQRI